ncbi:podoplanin [Cyprinodon tularosa]|uniref:podoplanin n=1 Tax=Cyprinodon tularosa TaxID=77115 RepID=UPI0018E2616D|nr:podoplanin [Cyprinodon tularosa]
MKVQLLLLLALAGPLCSFTRASPTSVPTDVMKVGEDIITGPPPTSPQAVPVITGGSVAPKAFTEVTTAAEDTKPTTSLLKMVTVAITEGASTESTILYTQSTLLPAQASSLPPITTADPALKTTPSAVTDTLPSITETTYSNAHKEAIDGTEENERMEIEDGQEEGLSSGHIVGIVIAAIVAVVIVGAVILSLWRKMGKYSP